MLYPRLFGEISEWAARNHATIADARRRFAQFVVLSSIASDPDLARMLIFKGGNALDFIWQDNRSTTDLDFTADPDIPVDRIEPSSLQTLFTRALVPGSQRHDMMLVVNKVVQNPPGPRRTFVTYRATIGYALPDEIALKNRIVRGISSSQIVPIDISINEVICATATKAIENGSTLRVCTLEDIVAEKLRALLQQAPRKRNRPQDLLDIAVAVQRTPSIDRKLVAQFVQVKSAAREIQVSKSAFQVEIFAELTRDGYKDLFLTTRNTFIPFDDALAILLDFVDQLPIPD